MNLNQRYSFEPYPKHLSKYVGIVLDEMHVKEGLYFDKHTGTLVGYSDLGEISNALLDYEQHLHKFFFKLYFPLPCPHWCHF